MNHLKCKSGLLAAREHTKDMRVEEEVTDKDKERMKAGEGVLMMKDAILIILKEIRENLNPGIQFLAGAGDAHRLSKETMAVTIQTGKSSIKGKEGLEIGKGLHLPEVIMKAVMILIERIMARHRAEDMEWEGKVIIDKV